MFNYIMSVLSAEVHTVESVEKGFVGEHRVFGKLLGEEIGRHPGQIRDREASPGGSMGPRHHH